MTKVSSEKQVAEHNAMHGGIHKKYIIPESRHIEWHPIQHPGAAGPIWTVDKRRNINKACMSLAIYWLRQKRNII